MKNVREIVPKIKKTKLARRFPPFGYDFDDFFENMMPRLTEMREPHSLRWPVGIDFEKTFKVDVWDREADLMLRAELPGVDKDDLEITLSGDYLTIRAEREFEEEEEKENFHRREVGYGDLVRTITLPCEVEAEKVKAILKEGMLEITLPKAQVAKRYTVKVA